MQQAPETFFNLADFVPDLREQFEPRPLGPKRFLLVAIPVEKPEQHPALVPAITDRQSISLTDGNEFWTASRLNDDSSGILSSGAEYGARGACVSNSNCNVPPKYPVS